jgi:small-conductance mechanosensitive channel
MPALFRRSKRAAATPEELAAAPTLLTPSSTRALRQLRWQAVQQAKRARREAMVVIPLLAGVIAVYNSRDKLPGPDLPVRIGSVVLLVVLGWALARDIGRVLGPALLRRLEPSTAGTVGFLIRLGTLAVAVIFALRVAGLRPETLAVGGALTAVVLGLAAQQTFGNLIAGLVLLSARPFKVGERIRLQGGGLAGEVEGRVATLGLLHTTLAVGDDSVLVPNSVVLNVAIIPLREPASVDLRARLHPGTKPSEIQAVLDDSVKTLTRGRPHITLEEVDDEEVVVRIEATPVRDEEGAKLADEVIAAVAELTRNGRADGAPSGGGGDGRPG